MGKQRMFLALMMVSNVILSTAIEPEAFGRISIEGQAMGKVVVASNIGGSLDTICRWHNRQVFTAIIRRLWQKPLTGH